VTVTAFAPGRVNLIGDHTDHTGGFVLPMAIELGTTVTLEPGGDTVMLRSTASPGEAVVGLDVARPREVDPPWARYVAGVVAAIRPHAGGRGTVATTLPIGAGLSSSAALELSVALALGFEGPPRELARACQRAEQLASGVPCGIMDQLASAAGRQGEALLIDCTSLEITGVALPPDAEVLVVNSGQSRALAGSAYAERRRQCEEAAAVVGPLRNATVADLAAIADPVLRARARHVITENERVQAFAGALLAGDLGEAGGLMLASHRSLAVDFEVSTPVLDALVADLVARPGVAGARLTGAGFGGCVVALVEAGAVQDAGGWRVHPSAGARRLAV
jgi:galactokinase